MDLPCTTIQADEIWSFVYSKQGHIPEDRKGEYGVGDVWTWVALDADTKLVASYLVGDRSADAAYRFISDLAGRLRDRVQLSTDGFRTYFGAIERAFGADIDYGTIVKQFENERPSGRYSPPNCIGIERHVVKGDPDEDKISTRSDDSRTRCPCRGALWAWSSQNLLVRRS